MIDHQSFLDHRHCVRLGNGTVDLVVATQIGPRVLRYGFTGSSSVFGEVPDLTIPTALGDWKPRGGHRLWAAPEMMPGSYAPDNAPIALDVVDDLTIVLRQSADPAGIEKRLTLALAHSGTQVIATHEIVNRTLWPIQTAAWALTIVAPNGRALLPQPPPRSHDEALQAACPLALWSFTDLTDPRWRIGSRLIQLSADADRPSPQKIGLGNRAGWCAFAHEDRVFIKRFDDDPVAAYPDYGSNNEVYTAGTFMEVETLGAFHLLPPGAGALHVERWYLFRGVSLGDTEATALEVLTDLLAQTV